MNKKFLILGVMVLLITILLSVKVSAATITSATITITSSKTEYQAGETVEYTIGLKDLNASNGIMGFGAYIEYDSNLLTLNTKATGLSDWSDATVSENTHRFVTTKESHSSNNENILKITFTAKETVSNVETSVSLKKIEISNGTQYDISEVTSNKITIKPKTVSPENPPVDQDPDDNNNNQNNTNSTPTDPSTDNNNNNNNNNNNSNNNSNNGNTNGSTNTNKGGNTSSTGNLPSLGVNTYLSSIILALVIIAIVSFVKIKMLDKKIIKQNQDFIDKNDKNN